jgi:AcrR family transcriptional regulator
MREKILEKAADLFLTYGFKSVTMDDIANKLGISKKTIYTHFENKTTLVKNVTLYLFEIINTGIDEICSSQQNPIEELFNIKSFVLQNLKDEKSSPQYQLQKYYPKIYQSLRVKQLKTMKECVRDNIERGIASEVYRKELDKEFITNIYFMGVMGIKDPEVFPPEHFNMRDLMENHLEYHIRAIATPKGLETLTTILNSQNEK